MQTPDVYPITYLSRREVVQWIGTEQALSWSEAAALPTGEFAECTDVIWTHPDIPYLQLIGIDIYLPDGSVLALLSQLDDGTGYYGLYLLQLPRPREIDPAPSEHPGIYRTRRMSEFPVGIAEVCVVNSDGPNAVLEARLMFGDNAIRILAGEIYEEMNGELRIVQPDESLLVQVVHRSEEA